VDVKSTEGVYDLLVSYRSGDMWAPKVSQTEALKLEAEHFIDCVTNNKKPINDGLSGLRVVQVLEAAEKSVKKKGAMIPL
jgi:predicted dehydrogenase